jgi:hypothetical protein
MNINVKLKRKFRIGNKEYNSIEEMPADVRETFEKAMVSQTGSGDVINRTSTRTKIIFNGTEYESIDAMSKDIRELYEKVLKAAETGTTPSEIDIAEMSRGVLMGHQSSGTVPSADKRKPAKTEPSFSPRALIVSMVLVALILLFYYLLRSR